MVTDPVRELAAVRATRVFTDQPVPRRLVESLVEAARWTGSARNRQPWRFVSVVDPRVRRALARLGQYATPLASAPVALVLLSDSEAGRDTEFDLGRVCQTLVLAAHFAGLGSCPVSLYPEANAVEAAALTGYGHPWRAHHALALGWPGQRPRGRSAIPTGRKELSELFSER
ncbi:nitroreductase family protein [Amycolatopsis thermophila]|uniref:Nitroreductase n=1 Tax=Amycolatopsis thermophila TaxID=206084 RepID=A0ABU0EP44_9PSEU|nr:nitroreductase family protein [Amycolatopsis thermophila]MDQ0377068.1 nitroreductase [Amycolatopsis thermophila]